MVPASGRAITVTVFDATALPQLAVSVYIMVSTPPPTPVTTPEVPTVAIDVLLLLQVPPGTGSVSVIVALTQTLLGPEMVPAERNVPIFTVIVATDVPHALVTVYLIVSRPGVMPVSRPALFIVALALVTLHVPPTVAFV
jgi:hypothetical protein